MSSAPSAPASESVVLYEAKGLIKNYDDGEVKALRGLDFQIRAGECVAIIGPSGCGKSTLLQMLGALDKPSGGALTYRGQSLADMPEPSEYRAQEIGFVFQSFHLLPTFTAIENVQLPMFEAKSPLPLDQRRKRAQELLDAVGLGHRADHFPTKLSGGERQRVAIARSLANGPTVLLADEPTGNLDSKNAKIVLELLLRLHQEQHTTLVLITHDMGIARAAPRAVQMKDGQIIYDGPPENAPQISTEVT